MALPVTIPNTFANATASIPLSQLDANFNTLANAVNGISDGSETLANVTATVANITTLNASNVQVTNIKANDGTASMSIADSTGIPTISKATVIETTDNTNAALRITQLGTGNALVVEDSTSPDSTPVVIDASGRIIKGSTTTQSVAGTSPDLQVNGTTGTRAGFTRWTNDSSGPVVVCAKSRGASVGTRSIVSSNDETGILRFYGDDGVNDIECARIQAAVDGTPGTNDMPGRLTFSTTADGASSVTERMRIDNAGRVGIGASAGGSTTLRVGKTITGGTTAFALNNDGAVQSDVTNAASYFRTVTSTQDAAFALPTLAHYEAAQGTITGGSRTAPTNQYGYWCRSSLTGATNNYGFFSDIADAANRYNFYANGTAANYFAGTIASLGSYTATTANAANMNIDSSGNIARSTSSIRYKKDVETLESQYADAFVAQARPVWYRSKSGADNANWGWYGLIAEEVAEIDPRLVHWGYPMKTVEHEPAVEAKEAVFDEEGNEVEPAVQAQEATYKEVPDTDAELQAEGVQYDRLTVLLLDVVKRQNESIKALEARVAALETGA